MESLEYMEEQDGLSDIERLDMASAFHRIGNVEKARVFLDSVDPSSPVASSLKYMAVKPEIMESSGDVEEALKSYRVFSGKIDSIHNDIFEQDLLFVKKRHDLEIASLIESQKKDNLILTVVSVAIILLFLAGFLYSRIKLGQARIRLAEQEMKTARIEHERLQKENERLELEKRNAELECERQTLAAENQRLHIGRLEEECINLRHLLEEKSDLPETVRNAIKVRIEMLNALLASSIAKNEMHSKTYSEWRDKVIQDSNEFMDTTRLAFKVSHPAFIQYLENRELTDSEINYVCLYAIGLRGKEVGDYIKIRRHYHISSDIRKKLGIGEHDTNLGIYIRKLLGSL